jgi:hypothetical protein
VSRGAAPSRWRGPVLIALSVSLATAAYLVHPGAVNDDTYGFLDWGRDLRHDLLPLLEGRTFQPLPILVGSVLSLLGNSAAPTAAILFSLTCLFLLAAGAWRIVSALRVPQPAPAFAALLIVTSPLLGILALVGYNNLHFATLIVWALVFELEARRRGSWTLLLLAGLVRPEGWAFLVAYGALEWWRRGRPRAAGRWLPIAALALSPMVLWVLLEWMLFGDALYSFHQTAGAGVQHTGSGSPAVLWHSMRASTTVPVLVAAAVGAAWIARFAPRRSGLTTLGATVLAALTIVVLAGSNFNVPSRHFSALIALVDVLAAVGAGAAAAILARRMPSSRAAVAGLGLAGVALVAGLAEPTIHGYLQGEYSSLDVSRTTGRSLSRSVGATLPRIDVRGARRHSVALFGAVANAELVWVLGVPFNVVADEIEPSTRLIVEPSPKTHSLLEHHHITNRPLWTPTPGWHQIGFGAWYVYARGSRGPARLG